MTQYVTIVGEQDGVEVFRKRVTEFPVHVKVGGVQATPIPWSEWAHDKTDQEVAYDLLRHINGGLYDPQLEYWVIRGPRMEDRP